MLEGLLVVELASVLAGPAVGQFFSELGARVIKIENATTAGDVTRSWKLPTEDKAKADSAYFRSVNYGKESLLLNLKTEADQAKVHTLLADADVVISNFPAATATKLRMDATTIREINDKIIYAQLDAFPSSMGKRPAYDIVLQAETGFLSMTGNSSEELCRMPVALIDILAAHQLKEGILIGLIKRGKTGKGYFIRTNLYAAAIASLANQATNYLIGGHVPSPMGCKHPNIAPYGDMFTTADGHRIVLAVGSDRQFAQLVKVLKLDLPPEFATNVGRVAHRDQMIKLLEGPISALLLSEVLLLCQSNNIPAGHVKNMAQVFKEPAAKAQLLTYKDGQQAPKTAAFTIEELVG